MSNDEKFIQWLKICIAVGFGLGFGGWAWQVLEILKIIAAK